MFVKKSIFMISGIFILIMVLNGLVFAAHPLTTDDAGLVAKEKFEIEVGYDFGKIEDEEFKKITQKNLGMSFKHGLTDKMDMGISLPYEITPSTSNKAGNAEVSFKFALLQDILAVSLTNELGGSDYFLNLILSQKIANFGLHFNVGYLKSSELYSGGNGIYNFALEHPVSEQLNAVMEINSDDYGFEAWLVGLQYEIPNYFRLSAGFGRTENGCENYSFGFHKEF